MDTIGRSLDPLVSVIMIAKNCGGLIDLVMPTVFAQTHRRLEVLIIDNGSDDGSLDTLRREYPAARVIELGQNQGFSHALNIGIQQSAGEFILSLNFDVVLEPEFLASILDAVRDRPDVGWAAGAMYKLTPEGVTTEGIDCFGHYLLRSRYCYGYDPDRPQPSSYGKTTEVFGASGCAALYRRSMLDDIAIDGEVFDRDLFAYFEDIDVDWRAQQRGFKCLFVPAARGAHMRGGTGLSRRPEVAALLLSNRFLVMLKNDGLGDMFADLAPIAARTWRDLAFHLYRLPKAVPIALARLVRLTPRMLRKRREIRRGRRADVSPAQRFRLPTKFLG